MGNGGDVANQTAHTITWISVEMKTIDLCWAGPNHRITLLDGRVALNAIRTTRVLLRMQEMHRTKLIPKTVWRIAHDQGVG